MNDLVKTEYVCLECKREFVGSRSFCTCGSMYIINKSDRVESYETRDPHEMQVLINRENDKIERERE